MIRKHKYPIGGVIKDTSYKLVEKNYGGVRMVKEENKRKDHIIKEWEEVNKPGPNFYE